MSDNDLTFDDTSSETTDPSFTQELTKTIAMSAASTAGAIAGVVLVGFGLDAVRVFRTKRAEKKAAADQAPPTEA